MFSTQPVSLPESCGKVCAELVDGLWLGWVQSFGLFHSDSVIEKLRGITRGYLGSLYTNCMHLYAHIVDKFTSVKSRLYTKYTGLTITTTTFIYNYLGSIK